MNTLNWQRDEMLTVDIDFDYDDLTADNFKLVTNDGFPVPHQLLSDEQKFWMETLKANRNRRVRILVHVRVPSCGYTTLYVQPKRHPCAVVNDWQFESRSAENRYLRLEIADDGGISLTHKPSGKTYSKLNHFEDVADAGDAYTFCPLQGDIPISTQGKSADIHQLWVGSNAVCFEIVHHFTLPAQLSEDRLSRVEKVSLTITSHVTLYRDCPYLHVEITFNNPALDHKLSVCFPTELNVPSAFVDESFAVVERPIDLPDSTGWVEDPTSLMHQRSFADLSDGEQGLAVFNRGLAAVEVNRTQTASISWIGSDHKNKLGIANNLTCGAS